MKNKKFNFIFLYLKKKNASNHNEILKELT